MRKILFRGRDRHGKWHFGGIRILAEGGAIIIDKDGNNHEVEQSTVGQFTGIALDGQDIFEGDILAVEIDGECHNWVVNYCSEDDYPAFDLAGYDGDCNGISLIKAASSVDAKIIGNIHDTPELMEVV